MTATKDLIINVTWSILSLVASLSLWSYFNSSLREFPGPILAGFTNIWRLLDVYRGRCDETHLKLHRKHGTVVRMGPNILSLSDPSLINRVYTTKGAWKKGDFYSANDARVNGRRAANIFSSRDEEWHATAIRPLGPMYSMTQTLDMEHLVDATIGLLCEKLDERFVQPGASCDIADYMMYVAWDTMGKTTFSNPLGMIEAGYDKKKFLQSSKRSNDYFACFSQMPVVDRLLGTNISEALGSSGINWAALFIQEQFQKRVQEESQTTRATADFTDKVIQAQMKFPEIVDDAMVIIYLLSNVVAGSDTTACTMSCAIYNILKHPSVHASLRNELDAANLFLPVRWKDLQQLPYFTAVMREIKRIHPAIAMILERIVPTGGLTLPDGRFVPEGTIVGMNPYVVNRDPHTFGSDSDQFSPERWLHASGETDEQFQSRLKKMQRAILTFGAGPRSCIGRNLSEMESDKVVATLFAKYEIELVNPQDSWDYTNLWFARQKNIVVTLKEKSAS